MALCSGWRRRTLAGVAGSVCLFTSVGTDVFGRFVGAIAVGCGAAFAVLAGLTFGITVWVAGRIAAGGCAFDSSQG